jgi:hypothetical protein
MSLLSQLLEKTRKAEIGFGIHENCRLLSIDNNERTSREGDVINKVCYLKFAKYSEKGEVIGEKEISWFGLDATSEYTASRFITQLEQLTAILDTYLGEDVKKWEEFFDEVLKSNEVEHTMEAFEFMCQDPDKLEAVTKLIYEGFEKLLAPKIGKNSQPIALKIVFDKNGKYLQQPSFGAFVANTKDDLKISKTELEYQEKSLATASSTAISASKIAAL